MWVPDELLAAAAAALRGAEEQFAAEQAVRGLDALEELDLHALIARGLADAGYGVLRERPYPGDRTTPREQGDDLAKESERRRCDIVLTPAPGQTLADPVQRLKSRRARQKQAAGTLFEAIDSLMQDDDPPAPGAIPPEDAFWLEIKLVGQFCFEAGIPGPNRTYGSQLVRGITADLAKLAADPHIDCGALLLILFTEDQRIADNDLIQAMHRALDKGVIASAPITTRFPIADRIGNRLCTLALIRASRG